MNNFVDISDELEQYPKFRDRFLDLRKKWGITEKFYKNELSKTTFVVGSGKSGMKMWYSKKPISRK